jgi:hypothetical protein
MKFHSLDMEGQIQIGFRLLTREGGTAIVSGDDDILQHWPPCAFRRLLGRGLISPEPLML